MTLLVEHVDVWAATIQDRPGAVAAVLDELREAGADLQFIIARRAPDFPGKGVLFVTPLQGDQEVAVAAQLGFNVTRSVNTVRVMGADRRGIAAELTRKIADTAINLRGFSASVLGPQFVAYIAVDSREDANRVIEVLGKA
jgi:predicted amino acid-binding ACT domain protein